LYENPVPPSKKEVMLALLERSEARVHLDARRDGVALPDRLRSDGHVRLDYGYGLTPPIADLDISDEGIRATLSFSRIPFSTFIPWTAVYLIADYDGNGAVWQEDIPPDLLERMGPETQLPDEQPEPPKPPVKARPNHLKLVK
jgi:hypothetical protein